jgi:CRISPR system Cascade subunit CasD
MPRDDDATLGVLRGLAMAVRVDRPGSLLRDFHTAGGGRFRGQKYTAHDTSSCVPTERYYLQDASFVAALEGDDALVARIASALRSPRWPLFLGRRSCPPAVPVLMGTVGEGAAAAVRSAALAERPEKGDLRLVVETDGGAGDARYDVPLSFAEIERRYGVRYVRTEWMTPPAPATEVQA